MDENLFPPQLLGIVNYNTYEALLYYTYEVLATKNPIFFKEGMSVQIFYN